MAALGINDSLLEVDLAENLIGKQETQKVPKPLLEIRKHKNVGRTDAPSYAMSSKVHSFF